MISSDSSPEALSQNVPYFRMHPGYPEGTQMFVLTPRGRNLQIHSNTVKELRDSGLNDQQVGHEIDNQEDEVQERIKAYRERQARLFPSDDDYYCTEDPLAGDVEPTGGYYEEPQHPWDAHMDRVHRDHGN